MESLTRIHIGQRCQFLISWYTPAFPGKTSQEMSTEIIPNFIYNVINNMSCVSPLGVKIIMNNRTF